MLVSTFLHFSSVFLAVAATVALPHRHKLRRDVPRGWSPHRRADPDAPVPLKFALAQTNLHNLDAYLLDIADPQSANYGKHWTPAEVAKTFGPAQDSIDTVHSWLVHDGQIDPHKIRLSADSSSLHLNVTVAEAERLLAAEYYVYRRGDDGSERVRCHDGYHLPEHVSKHVDLVWPTVHFGGPTTVSRRADGNQFMPPDAPKASEAVAPGPTDCDQSVTLDCLRGLYDFNYTLVSPNKNSIAVVEFGAKVYQPSDLDVFFERFDPEQVGRQPTLISIAGGHLNASETDVDNLEESTMDLQLVMGLLGRKQDVLLYQVGKDDEDQLVSEELLAAFDASYCSVKGVNTEPIADCGNKPRANVVSISYATNPDLFHPAIVSLLRRQCAEFGKLSLTGMTFVVSSGNSGVSFGPEEVCDDDGRGVSGNAPGAFIPQFPASCPYVTAVGATSVAPGNSVHDREVATTAFLSGGGFSNIFPRPSFQDRAVNAYLKTTPLPYPAKLFNRAGRAYPDVSANGFPIVVALGGGLTTRGGTSASAPIFASLVAAVNDARLAAGKGPVGWINPAIYSHLFTSAFNDVTEGSNPGCATAGFPAAHGWDPVTGLGTPNFPRLLARFMALP